jgi:alpha-mannosidase
MEGRKMNRIVFALLAVLLASPLGFAAESSAPAATAADDVSFCNEVLILHHSHVDIGYTHPQSMYWELQKDYLTAALDMLDRTEAWPDDLSKPRWTAEVTSPVMRWLQTATAEEVERLKKHIQSGRFGISGFEYNTTPLCSAEGLARQLYHVRTLREELGADIRVVHQHDVTGIPWTAVDLLLDSRIELLVMGINLHLSGTPKPRPAVYRWQGPSGRELLVLNGEHYSMFDQWCNTNSRNLDTIQAGLDKYLRHVKGLGYPYDFVYLSATHAPLMYDNSPPNQDLPDVVRRWNEEGRRPRLRLATPNDVLARLRQIPVEKIPLVRGDWTDYWNFGCASSAAETTLCRRMSANAAAVELLRMGNGPDPRFDGELARLWDDIHLYNEHTWGAAGSLDADHPNTVMQWHLKAYPAYDGKPLSDFLLRKELHRLAGNPWQSWDAAGVLVVNPTGLRQTYYVPDTWKGPGKRIESAYMARDRERTARPLDNLLGPVELEPFSWQVVPWAKLQPAPAAESLRTGGDFIETAHYRLTFDPATGKITGLFDQLRQRPVVAADSPWGFFQLVHERPSTNERSAFHVRSVEGERYGRTGWKPDWQATRTGYSEKPACAVEKRDRSATLVIKGQAAGLTELEQRITLHADSPVIDLSCRMLKQDVRTPEALYFAFPISMDPGWRAHFDTAGIPTELDAEQLPGACRDWVTVDTFASLHQADFGVTLYCPDAPLVQIGNFHWAKKQDAIPRQANPLLLAWPLNNYWETNFRSTQPGVVEFRYAFASHGAFDPVAAVLQGQQASNPPVTHLVLDDASPRQGRFLEVQGDRVVVSHVKPAEDRAGLIARVVNLGDQPSTARIALSGRNVTAAWRCGTLEENQSPLELADGAAVCPLPPRQITTVRIQTDK